MNYYRRYVGDYMRDTASLSIAEHGAYNLLLDYAYATERPIPGDREEVLRLLRAFTPEERKAVDKVLARFWILDQDGYSNPRVDEELAKSSKLIEKQKANGSLGGRPKKTHLETQPLTQTETQNNQPPTTNHQPPAANLQPPEKGTVGQEPDASPPKRDSLNGKRSTAIAVLDFLNEKTGRRYKPVKANLELIAARLREGASEEDLRAVVAKKCREWSGDAAMAIYLRPATLFNATKFAQYQGELGAPDPEKRMVM